MRIRPPNGCPAGGRRPVARVAFQLRFVFSNQSGEVSRPEETAEESKCVSVLLQPRTVERIEIAIHSARVVIKHRNSSRSPYVVEQGGSIRCGVADAVLGSPAIEVIVHPGRG